MPEQHNIEWKSTWKDEYLKWICGFANAQGESVQASGNKLERIWREILAYGVEARSLGEISAKLGLRHLSYLRKVYIKPLLGSSLEMTHPENLRHMHQRYRTIMRGDQ